MFKSSSERFYGKTGELKAEMRGGAGSIEVSAHNSPEKQWSLKTLKII